MSYIERLKKFDLPRLYSGKVLVNSLKFTSIVGKYDVNKALYLLEKEERTKARRHSGMLIRASSFGQAHLGKLIQASSFGQAHSGKLKKKLCSRARRLPSAVTYRPCWNG